jgi:hypothetical protein
MRAPGGRALCPVCRWPDKGRASCAECNATLRGGYVVGPAPEDERRAHAARLTASRRRYDLSAALRAAGPTAARDRALLDRLTRLVRGGAPQAAEVEIAAAEYDQSESVARRDAAVGMRFAFTRLVAEETDAVQFVAIGPAGVSVVTFTADELGVPVPVPGGSPSLSWQQVSPAVAADADSWRYWLAGGISDAGPEDRRAFMAETAAAAAAAVRRLLDEASMAVRLGAASPAARDSPRADRVLVHRAGPWPALDAAIAAAQPVIRPIAEITDLSDLPLRAIADKAATYAPLRYEYAAMLVRINPLGAVSVVPQTLFPAGTVLLSYDQPTAHLRVRVPPAAADRIAIPVVARRGSDASRWPQVGRAVIESVPGASVQLTVQVKRPGHVSFLSRTAPDDESVPNWPELLSRTPRELASDAPADLVILVEIGPTAEAAAARLDMLDAFLGKLSRPDIRVAIVGYRDHHLNATTVMARPLDTPDHARQLLPELRDWKAVHGDDYAAPLEDALHWVETARLDWRARARHMLLVCGSRPAHEHKAGGGPASYCPNHHDWQRSLTALRNERSAECLALVDDEAWGEPPRHPARRFWELLCGNRRPLSAGRTSEEALARALGLAADAADVRLYLARIPEGTEER